MAVNATMARWFLLAAALAFSPFLAESQIRLPRLISEGMVVQRDAEVNIWGWDRPGERVSLRFIDSGYTTTTGPDGKWSIILPSLKAGGPYDMHFQGSDSTTVHDVLVGDVWVCSGQSNMELPMRRVRPRYPEEIAHATNGMIRQFAVPQTYDFNHPHDDLSAGSWKSVTPANVLEFSAVGYFFAAELYRRHNVPVGLINASLGGSPAEAWMSEEALAAFPVHLAEAHRFRDSTLIARIEQGDNSREREWYSLLNKSDKGYRDGTWWRDDLNTSTWNTMAVPGSWSGTPLAHTNGVVWFRREITLPARYVGTGAKLNLGRIVDADSVRVNGTFVGTTSYQYPPRWYEVPPGVLRAGRNTFVVRVISTIETGGFVPDKEYALVTSDSGIDLRGQWHYRVGAIMKPLQGPTFIRWKPLGLYNAMIAPLLNYRITGVIWYQGESNAGRPLEYRALFPALINDWRQHWNEGAFPFLFVQLANFMAATAEPSNSNWALLREAQSSALALPHTGMAVTIDIGEWNDIHPLDKKDVALRLARAAEKIAYGVDTVVASGPVFRSMSIEGDSVVLRFSHTGNGLVARGGKQPGAFAIASGDRKFVWAKATVRGDSVVVRADGLDRPVAVRYAWGDNPIGATLYNAEGLPAVPFRTDDWDALQTQ